jgi:putative peptidoglycan lipid II flippase
VIRVALTTVLGYLCAVKLPPFLGIDLKWGTAGLTASAGVAGWVEFVLLRGTINSRLGATGIPASVLLQLWTSALAAAAVGWGARLVIGVDNPLIAALAVLGSFGLVYLGMTLAIGVPEARGALSRVRRLRN